jgi:hypothetical protein
MVVEPTGNLPGILVKDEANTLHKGTLTAGCNNLPRHSRLR